jgi:hypothetical protein
LQDWDKFKDPRYVAALLNFSMIEDGQASNPWFTDTDWRSSRGTVWDYLNQLSRLTHEHHMAFSLSQLFWEGYFTNSRAPVQYLLTASTPKIEQWMRDRVKRFFATPYFNQVNFANEAINNDWKTKQPVWNSRPSPMYRAYGQEWPEMAYRLAWEEASRTGRSVGKDLHLVYNTAGLEMESSRADYEFNYLKGLKAKLSQDLGPDQPFDIGFQFHLRLSLDCRGAGPTAADMDSGKLAAQLRRFGEIGDIRITEFSICGARNAEEEKRVLRTVFEAVLRSKVCKSFLFWDAFVPLDHTRKPDDLAFSMRNLFGAGYQPSYMLQEFRRILEAHAPG